MKVQEILKRGLIRACVATLLLFAIQAQAQKVLATVSLPHNAASYVALNEALNKIYVSGGAASNQLVFVINGSTFKGGVAGDGSGVSVDAVSASTPGRATIGPPPSMAKSELSARAATTWRLRGFPQATAARW
jgi:hypothetical protein